MVWLAAWTLAVGAAAPGLSYKSTAFDPKEYIKSLPADLEDDVDDEPVTEPTATVAPETSQDVAKAEVQIKKSTFLALRSAFGTIYLPKSAGIKASTLASAVCADKTKPDHVGKDEPLTADEALLAADILKTIERQCSKGSKGS